MLERYRRRRDLLAQLQRLTRVEEVDGVRTFSGSQGVLLGLAAAIKEDARGLKFTGLTAASPFAMSLVATTLSSIGLYRDEEDPEHLDLLIQTMEEFSPDPGAHDCPPRDRLLPEAAVNAVCEQVGRFDGTGIWPLSGEASTACNILERLGSRDLNPVHRTVLLLQLDLYYNTEHLTFLELLRTDPIVMLYVGQLISALAGFYAGDERAIDKWLEEALKVTSLAEVLDRDTDPSVVW